MGRGVCIIEYTGPPFIPWVGRRRDRDGGEEGKDLCVVILNHLSASRAQGSEMYVGLARNAPPLIWSENVARSEA